MGRLAWALAPSPVRNPAPAHGHIHLVHPLRRVQEGRALGGFLADGARRRRAATFRRGSARPLRDGKAPTHELCRFGAAKSCQKPSACFAPQYGFDGVDYNWEYPGYAFGTGYKAEAEVDADYAGLRALLQGKIIIMLPRDHVITALFWRLVSLPSS